MKNSLRNLQSGQVGVVVLLIMIVILTIAIGLSQRTIQEQEIAFTQDESIRVFNAAETGVEDALSSIAQYQQLEEELLLEHSFSLEDSQISYSITENDQFDMFLNPSNVVQIPLLQTEENITINWWYQRETDCNNSSNTDPAAVVVSVLSASNAVHYAFDPCENQRGSNMEEPAASSADGYSFSTNILVNNDDRVLRLRPVFNSTRFLVNGRSAINLAQYDISSSAYNEQEDLARSIDVKRSLPGAFGFMDFALVSGSSLTKN